MHFVTEEGALFVNETGTYKMSQSRVEILGTSWAGECDLRAGFSSGCHDELPNNSFLNCSNLCARAASSDKCWGL